MHSNLNLHLPFLCASTHSRGSQRVRWCKWYWCPECLRSRRAPPYRDQAACCPCQSFPLPLALLCASRPAADCRKSEQHDCYSARSFCDVSSESWGLCSVKEKDEKRLNKLGVIHILHVCTHQKVTFRYAAPLQHHFGYLLNDIRPLYAVLPVHDIVLTQMHIALGEDAARLPCPAAERKQRKGQH